MRLSFVEAVCLVAIGATVVELHDGHRFGRTAIRPESALATAAKPAVVAGQIRSKGSVEPDARPELSMTIR